MPLEKIVNIMKAADKKGQCVAAFNTFNYESIAWLIETAEEENSPVIVMLYPGMSSFIPMSTYAAITRDLASKVKVPIGLHLDHSNSYEQILGSIKDGFSSVMFDGSAFSYEENVKITAQVVRAAHALDVDVEAELGHVGSASKLEDYTNVDDYTNVSLALKFIEETKVDSLALAIGSAHGNYVSAPKLDLKRLEEINSKTELPLVLHGGTGIPDDQIRKAVKLGINKLNIGTEYNQTFYRTIGEIISEKKSGDNMYACLLKAKVEVKEYIRSKINLLRLD